MAKPTRCDFCNTPAYRVYSVGDPPVKVSFCPEHRETAFVKAESFCKIKGEHIWVSPIVRVFSKNGEIEVIV